ncbi:MAG: recombination mediator RecR [Muribaculaceae bacterium]|nr:recombination mediator RecR [Muribaculaceae bacterium]MDE6093768.1 recombination mediator RecR [Muribaculaceae bacterium]MDE6610862.1 recombination mediator RecR [Muribaculaceae bacterium]
MEQEYESGLLESAVTELSRLPGVGRKTALRLALHLLRQDKSVGTALGESLINLCNGIKYCSECHNISEDELCPICANPMRDHRTVCVVESVKDVMAIENTRQYQGVYHVLGGLISPIDGVGPDQLQIDSLVERVKNGGNVDEVIIALSATMEGETTGFYIFRRLGETDVKVTQLARGVAVGNDLEYTDEITLGRSLTGRTLFSDSI